MMAYIFHLLSSRVIESFSKSLLRLERQEKYVSDQVSIMLRILEDPSSHGRGGELASGAGVVTVSSSEHGHSTQSASPQHLPPGVKSHLRFHYSQLHYLSGLLDHGLRPCLFQTDSSRPQATPFLSPSPLWRPPSQAPLRVLRMQCPPPVAPNPLPDYITRTS